MKKTINFLKKDYEKYIKNYCVSCETSIPKTWTHYLNYGNYCSQCSGKADRLVKIKSKLENIKNKLKKGYKKIKKTRIYFTENEIKDLQIKQEELEISKDKIINSLPNYANIDFNIIFN